MTSKQERFQIADEDVDKLGCWLLPTVFEVFDSKVDNSFLILRVESVAEARLNLRQQDISHSRCILRYKALKLRSKPFQPGLDIL